MGRLNRRDNEMDDGSSSGEVDEGRRAVAVDDVIEEEAPAGQREVADGGWCGFAAGAERLWRPGILNGEKEVMGGGTVA